MTILIDYNYLPIRCRYCLNTQHRVRACPARLVSRKLRWTTTCSQLQHTSGRKPARGSVKPSSAPASHNVRELQPATPSLPDDDGFQVYVPKYGRKGCARPTQKSNWDIGSIGNICHPQLDSPTQFRSPSTQQSPTNQNVQLRKP